MQSYSKSNFSIKGHISCKIWWKKTKCKLCVCQQSNIPNFSSIHWSIKEKVQKIRILSPKSGITHSKFDKIKENMNLICESSLQSHIHNFSSIPQSMSKKGVENYLCVIFQVQKNSFKIWQNQDKLEVDLWLITTKPYTIFQLNTLKHVEKSAENYLCVIF